MLRSSPVDSYLTDDGDSIWMITYVDARFDGMTHAEATNKVMGYFSTPAPTPAPAPTPPKTPTVGAPNTAEAFCSSLPIVQYGKWFYCSTVQGNLQKGLPNGWPGYCQVADMNLGLVGYSATMFNGGADAVRDFAGAQNTCNMLNTGGLRQCGSIIQCTRQ